MKQFELSSSQKMLLFSEINNPHNDSFYLKFRKDYGLDDFDNIKDLTRIKAGLTAEGIRILEDKKLFGRNKNNYHIIYF